MFYNSFLLIFIVFFCKKIYMEISNSNQIIKYKLILRSITFLFLVLIILSVFTDLITFNLQKYYYTAIFTALLLIFEILMFAKNATYVLLTEDYDTIIIKYYKLKLFKGDKKSIIFNKEDLYKYKINKKGLYKHAYITLFVKTKNGIAKYEPINIGMFKQNDVNNLLSIFDKSIKK